MHRIASLPRRDWRDLASETVPLLTDALRTPGGGQTLRDFQAVALRECLELGGAYVIGDVGVGKTLITLVAGELMQEERVLILVQQGDKAKTEREFDEYRRDWKGVSDVNYKLFGYGDISSFPKQGLSIQGLWGGLGPTLIICDEADKLRRVDVNKGASALALQISDYIHQNPDCKLIALTATPEKESIKDYWHILVWCLGDKSPLPITPDDVDDWSEVIDRGDPRCARKVCKQLGIPETEDVDVIRDAYHERLHSAPGVLISDAGFDGPLEIESHLVPPWGMEPHFAKLREFWQRPDGWDLSPDAPTPEEERQPDRVTGGGIWSCARQMALGFCYVADPVPPEPWREARKLAFKVIRTLLRRREFYTTQQVWQAFALGQLRPVHQKTLARWKEIEPTFTPSFRPLWLSNHALELCQEWGEEAPGIIWVDHLAFGAKLSQLTGWDFYGAGGKCGRKKIDTLFDYKKREAATCTVIASRTANHRGRNLQAWNRMLFTAVPANNRDFQQAVGRSHRSLQWRDVKVDVLVGCKEHRESIEAILLDAQRQDATLMKQKATNNPWAHIQDYPKGLFYYD